MNQTAPNKVKKIYLCTIFIIVAAIGCMAQKTKTEDTAPSACNRPPEITTFSSATPENKAFFWQQRFVTILADHLELTPEQKAFIKQLSKFLTIDNIAQFRGNENQVAAIKAKLKTFSDKAVELFPDENLAREVFMIPTPSQVGKLGYPTACYCSYGSYFNFVCDIGTSCRTSRYACIATLDGCGFLGLMSCDGFCQ